MAVTGLASLVQSADSLLSLSVDLCEEHHRFHAGRLISHLRICLETLFSSCSTNMLLCACGLTGPVGGLCVLFVTALLFLEELLI